MAPIAISFALAAHCSAADWLRIRASQIEVLTDAGENIGRAALERLLDIHRVLRAPNSRPLPLRVFVFSSEKEFRGYAGGPVPDSFYQSGPERDFIVSHAGSSLSREVAHEYVHWIMDQGLPAWFEEGTAELYSNLVFQRGQTIAGSVIPAHLAILAGQSWLTADEVLEANRMSPFYSERRLAGAFYAESWALAHMLNLAPGWREKMPVFAEALANGKDQGEAFRAAFGKTMEQALTELRLYVSRMQSVILDAAPPVGENQATIERIEAIEASLVRADLALSLRNLQLARTLLEAAKKSSPNSPDAEAGLGFLALAEDQRDRARTHLEHAIELRSKDPGVYFQLAMLIRESGKPAPRVSELLNQAVKVDPNFGEAHFVLGTQASGDGDYEAAAGHLRAAARAMPSRSYVWYTLAFAQMKMGATGEARASTARAIRTATTQEEEATAQALLESLGN